MVDTEGIAKLAIGLTIALVIVAYVAPIGIEALYDKDYRSWGWKHEGGEQYQYNDTTPGWETYNGTHWVATTTREDTKTSALMKLLPLFAVLVIVVAVVMIVRDKMR